MKTMRPAAALLVVLAALLAAPVSAEQSAKCLGCTLVLGLLNQRALHVGQSPSAVMAGFCGNATNPIGKLVCNLADGYLEKIGIDKVSAKTSPETACQQLGLCEQGACVLFSQWPPASGRRNPALDAPRAETPAAPVRPDMPGNVTFGAVLHQVLELLGGNLTANIEQVFDRHVPMAADDRDRDTFSPAASSGLRGSSWRGVDCDDKQGDVYPGRRVTALGPEVDHNCNGVAGAMENGSAYEDVWCGGEYAPRSLIAIGDSATAHFGIPTFLLHPDGFFNDSNWAGIMHFASNEGDWPECSWSTGYEEAVNCPPILGGVPSKVVSLYTLLKERNRCMANDRQNLGVNGARTTNTAPPGDITALHRNPATDQPALVSLALIGNDVCNGHTGDTLGAMTTPAVFRQKVVSMLQYLDTVLAPGSGVFLSPLADGSLLYDVLHNRTHPIGVTYAELYGYLTCTGKTPCAGWMTNNATLRAATTAHAEELSAIYPEVVANHTFKNFKAVVAPSGMMKEFVDRWIDEGKDPSDLITDTDGFHPSQTAQIEIAKYLYSWLEQKHPDLLGPVNPHNDAIVARFGEVV